MPSIVLALVLIVAVLPSGAARCQEPPAPPAAPAEEKKPQEAPPPATPEDAEKKGAQPGPALPDGDIEILAKCYAEWREADAQVAAAAVKEEKIRDKAKANRDKAAKAFLDQLQKSKETMKGADVLSLVDSWARIFARSAALKKTPKPEGLGRVLEKRVDLSTDGLQIGYEYALHVPAAYDVKKSWPVVIALHDKGSDGLKYLNEVWMKSNDPEFKALRDQFIFVAPTIGERTAGKRKEDQQRIEWFDKWHLFGISRCLVEVLNAYNVDTARIFVDGCGLGGQTAIELAIFQGKLFAAVAARSAEPKSTRYLPNLQNQSAVLLVSRKDGVFSTAKGKLTRDQIEQAVGTYKLDLQFKDYDPLPNKAQQQKAQGSQMQDPVHDANADVLRFFAAKVRNTHPLAIYFQTNNLRRFKRGAWAVVDKGDADPERGSEVLLTATIDRAKNVIDVRTENVESFRVYLNDQLVDMDRAVKVLVNGKEAMELKIDRSLDYLLDYHKTNPTDPTSIFLGEIQVRVPSAEAQAAPGGEAEKPGEGKKGDGKD